jgi:Cu2+-exporting ATPase
MQVSSEKPIASFNLSSEPTPSLAHDLFTLDVGGMKCAGCVKAVENQLMQQPGVVAATVNLVTEVAVVECQPGTVTPESLAEKLTEVGFPTQPRSEQADLETTPAEKQQLETQRRVRQVTVAATLLVLSSIGHFDHFIGGVIPGLGNIWFHWALATLALLFPGRSILVDGWKGLRRNAPNMNTLVGLGTLTAYITSCLALVFPQIGWECFFDEPVMLVGFILLGRALEQQARGKAAASLQSLLTLQPKLARLIKNNGADGWEEKQAIEIPVSQVKVGEWLRVLPGERIPVDGEIVIGQTTIDESMLTGEAVPVSKKAEDPVSAGSLNLSGAIAVKVTQTGKNTTLAQIIALVETAQTRKAPIQGLADTIAGYFTYGVMTIAALTFLFWYFIGIPLWGDTWTQVNMDPLMMHHAAAPPPSPLLLSLKLAIAVLVIACPCALGLATPTAILVGSGIGAENGLLIRGGDVLEKVHRLQTIVFDKTGTLTLGHPLVTDCLPLAATITPSELLQLAATVESGTQHPLAIALRHAAQAQDLPLLPATAFYTEPGLGVSAQVHQQLVVVGTAAWLTQQGIAIEPAAQTQASALAASGKTVVYVGVGQQLIGLIAARDALRSDAQPAIAQLKQMGLRVLMLTGDQPTAANAIARDLQLTDKEVIANVRPDGKAAILAQLQAEGQRVAMVGDGINDAPALAQADVGIALHSGTDVAIETAGIILMRDRLSDVVESIQLSRATFHKIQQNLFWALIYNVLGIPIAAGILLPWLHLTLRPAVAGAFMAFSSVSVVTNSLLLRRSFTKIAS